MDNQRIDVTWEGKERFYTLLSMAVEASPGCKVASYWADDEHGLVFRWHDGSSSRSSTKFPTPVNAEAACDFAWGWLRTQDYGKQPDHDGDNGKGWRIYNESWGHVASDHYAFIAIQPAWAMYGK